MITVDDFKKIEIKIGKVVSCEKVPDAGKLLKLVLDVGGEEKQVLSGIAEFYQAEDLVGKELPLIVNLEPRTMRGLESQGMILVADDDGKLALLHPDKEVSSGSTVR